MINRSAGNPIAILGSGGKMGFRITTKLVDAGYDVRAVEIGDTGKQRLAAANITSVATADGIAGAKVIIFALPDNVIGSVIRDLSSQIAPGTMLLILDAAAPYADDLPVDRPDLTYFVGHPCHPPLFSTQTQGAERLDFI